MSKIRLRKVVLQPYFSLEDEDGNLEDLPLEEPREVKAKDWPAYSGETFPAELAGTQAALDAEGR